VGKSTFDLFLWLLRGAEEKKSQQIRNWNDRDKAFFGQIVSGINNNNNNNNGRVE
jgi:hypothetical protein